jgi:hypothetical protein
MPQARLRFVVVFRWLLIFALAISGAVAVARAALGPFEFPFPVHSPLVSEGVCALAATLLFLLRNAANPQRDVRRPTIVVILLLTAAALAPCISLPLVCDEFRLAAAGRAMRLSSIGYEFTHAGADRFFRPLADATLGIDARWAGLDPAGWHVLGYLLHLVNTLLVFLFARRVFESTRLAAWAAAFFGMHGSRPEAVAFLTRFDQLATLFVLAGLLIFDRYLESPRSSFLATACALMLAGLCSKESAYVFPLLAVWPVAVRGDWTRAHLLATAPFFAITAAVFGYRWYLLGGIGGYPDVATGKPQILNIRVLALVKALTLRLWGLLYFPINWSDQPEAWLAAAMAASVAALLCLVLLSRGNRRTVGFAALFTWIAALPVAHMLLIGADLRGAAHLYLPSIGFCLFLAAVIDGAGQSRVAQAAGVALLLFQFAALQHNIRIWRGIGDLANRECRTIALQAAQSPKTLVVQDPPLILDGIAFFANGLPECVAMYSPGTRISIEFTPKLTPHDDGAPVYGWNASNRRFEAK